MNIALNLPALVIAVPLVFAPLIPLFGMINVKLCWYAALISTAAAFSMALTLLFRVADEGVISYHMGGWAPPIGIEYRIDMLSAFVLTVITFVSLLSLFYAKVSVEKEIAEHRHPYFYALYMLFCVGLYGITVTGDLFNIYVFLEITSLSGYALIAAGRKRFSLAAAFNYLIIGTLGATFIVIGIGYIYVVTGTLNIIDAAERLQGLHGTTAVLAAYSFLIAGLFIKMAVFPLHSWMPDSYAYSPSAVSTVLAATSTKVSAYVLIRLMYSVFDINFTIGSIPMTEIIVFFAALSIISGSILALAQKDMKKMLAYSSVGQLSYVLLAAALVNTDALTGGLIHIFNHALMKGGLFFVVGLVVYVTGSGRISSFAGLGKRMPLTAFSFTVFALSIIGVPLTVGFISKWYLVLGAVDSGHFVSVAVILVSSLLTAVYFGRVIFAIYFEDAEDSTRLKEPLGMVLPMMFTAFLCIFFGIFASFPADMASGAAEYIIGGAVWK